MAEDPLGIIMLCPERCSDPFSFKDHMAARCTGVPRAYIPVDMVGTAEIERLRARHLERNEMHTVEELPGGKKTAEELEDMLAELEMQNEGGPAYDAEQDWGREADRS